MRCGVRLSLLGLGILIIFSIFVIHYLGVLSSIWAPYDVGSYLTATAYSLLHDNGANSNEYWDGIVQDKIIVLARLESEDTDWVEQYLPDWQRAIYTVNPTATTLNDPLALTIPVNKGHEAMPYLTYIIDHYHDLPATIVFLHAHRNGFSTAWHTDAPMHDSVVAMQALQLPFVESNSYVNLRCNPNPGCDNLDEENTHITDEVWKSFFANASITAISQPARSRSRGHAPAASGAPKIHTACCAQFAVSRKRVRDRPVDDYIWFREWLLGTELDDAQSGRVFEFLWHVIFGMEPVHCPEREMCMCQVYGRC